MKESRSIKKKTHGHGCLDFKQTEISVFLSSHLDCKYNACSCVSSYVCGKNPTQYSRLNQ